MLQYPVNVYPNSQALDGTLSNTFTFIFRGDILQKYQIYIYNNTTGASVYTGSEITVTAYNGDTVSATIPSSSFSNALDLVWKVKLWDTSSGTITSPGYFFKSRTTPTLSVPTISNPHTSRTISLNSTYSQAQSVAIRYHIWSIYDSNNVVIDTTDKVYSANLSYSFDGLLSGETYYCNLTVVNQDGVSITTGNLEINVSYTAPNVESPPKVAFDKDLGAAVVTWPENNQSVGIASGDYEFVENFPFSGTNSVNIISGNIEFNELSNDPLDIDTDNFSLLISTNITEEKQDIIVELSDGEEENYSVSILGFHIYESRNGDATLLGSIFPTIRSGQTETGIPESNTGYIYSDTDTWNDDFYWTESEPFSNQYLFVLKPDETIMERLDD